MLHTVCICLECKIFSKLVSASKETKREWLIRTNKQLTLKINKNFSIKNMQSAHIRQLISATEIILKRNDLAWNEPQNGEFLFLKLEMHFTFIDWSFKPRNNPKYAQNQCEIKMYNSIHSLGRRWTTLNMLHYLLYTALTLPSRPVNLLFVKDSFLIEISWDDPSQIIWNN